jgi:IS4 transposase
VNSADCKPMKTRLVLQTQILNCWVSIARAYNQELLENVSKPLTEFSVFRIIEQSWTPEGVVTEKVIRRWMEAEI